MMLRLIDRGKRLLSWSLILFLATVGTLLTVFWMSLPKLDGKVALPGLRDKVEVASDGLGLPSIDASNREDALRTLGWIHARDRLFQMELIRRKSAGRLAELFGPVALDLDRRQRAYGFEQAARSILLALPEQQKRALTAYAEGVNAFLAQAQILPPEFLVLRHSPEPWRAEDSLLVGIAMFQNLTSAEEEERMLSVMEKALPNTVVQFLTPDQDSYDTVLVGGTQSRRPERPIPVGQWASLGRAGWVAGGVDSLGIIVGSNQWVIGGAKTRDGRAILADDMHLSLGIPNIWYRASLHYEGLELNGVTLPGLPLLIVGSNGRVAWGFTNTDADVADLVRLQINPDNPDQYKAPGGWRSFERREEKFRVKGGEEVSVDFKGTIWGPLMANPLLGQPVAVHWTALQTTGVDLGMLDMDRATTLDQAMEVMNHSGGPTQNVAIADDQGHIGWTLMGRYPLRQGFDGSVSESWADGNIGWNGYIPPEKLPRLIDPPQGFITTANNRTVGRDYPFILAHNQANGYRAYRIAQRLSEMEKLDERDMFSLQLDTRSEFFDFYRNLALAALDGEPRQDPELEESRRYIEAWNGHMDADSLGIGLLWLWREKLAAVAFAPIVARCRQVEPGFAYTWRKMETPLRALLTQRLPATLPSVQYRDWQDLLLKTLAESAKELKQRQDVAALADLTWGDINRVPIRHPFSKSMPFLSPLLDMADKDVSGCSGFCVRIVGNGHGATERMVVSPGHPQQGILHMPGGQSGHPMSSHYRDQQPAWQEGIALPFLPGEAKHTLSLMPSR